MGGKGAGRQKSVLDLGGKGVFVISVGKRVFFILGGKRVFISVGGKGVFATGGKGVFVICGKNSGGKSSGVNGVAAQEIPIYFLSTDKSSEIACVDSKFICSLTSDHINLEN